MMQILCTQCVNGKLRPVETIPGMGEGDKEERWRGVNSGIIYLL
jgi:hypothetical protein